MNLLKITLLILISLFVNLPKLNAQDCFELYKQAEAYKKSKKYSKAMLYYEKAKECDSNLSKQCDENIAYCRKRLPFLTISEDEIVIPYQGGGQTITVDANNKWSIEGETDWCCTDSLDKKNFVIQCRAANNTTQTKTTIIVVKSGDIFRSIKVTQKGRPEYVEAGSTAISFPAQGMEEKISIDSNVDWNVVFSPNWCKVTKNDSTVSIVAFPNDKVIERTDKIVIETSSKSVIIRLYQGAGDEKLTLSQNNLILNEEGDVHYLRVYTDAGNWFVGDYPTWMNVQRVGKDSIRIECGKNEPNGQPRSGSVQVRTDRQTAGVMITQSPLVIPNLFFPNSKLISGRNISFGVSASYYAPFIQTSAGTDYVGSVIDYGLGTSAENASYKFATGFSIGAFADIRLYKNIYMNVGLNFSQIKYENTFNQNTILVVPLTLQDHLRGEVMNSYKEEYTHTMIEIPILASYRIKVNKLSHIQFNIGPVLQYGLSAKMKFSGNTNSDTMHRHYNSNYQLVNNANYSRHTAVNEEVDLYKSTFNYTMIYTMGNDTSFDFSNQAQESPFKKFNYGLRVGTAYEWAGLSFGITYTYILSNMANKNYWENERWTMLNQSTTTMKGYKHRLNTLEFKIAYTLRYL